MTQVRNNYNGLKVPPQVNRVSNKNPIAIGGETLFKLLVKRPQENPKTT